MSMYVIMQRVYWSDVRERTIRRVQLDGSSSSSLVVLDSNRGIGIVDGMRLN